MLLIGRPLPAKVVVWIGIVTIASPAFGQGGSTIDGPRAPDPPEVVSRDAQGRVTARAVRLADPLVIDGLLRDPVYSQVPAISDFVQQEPHEGEPATESTELWIFFDDTNLYVSARCLDSEPGRTVANEMRRDGDSLNRNDNIHLVFDTFHDHRSGFAFVTNALGALGDEEVSDERTTNPDWNTVWDVKSARTDEGWSVEIVIPFKSLRYRRAVRRPGASTCSARYAGRTKDRTSPGSRPRTEVAASTSCHRPPRLSASRSRRKAGISKSNRTRHPR